MARRWIVIDIVVVLVFVGIGRANHHHGDSFSGMVSTTWPFAVGLAIGWFIVLVHRRRPGFLRCTDAGTATRALEALRSLHVNFANWRRWTTQFILDL